MLTIIVVFAHLFKTDNDLVIIDNLFYIIRSIFAMQLYLIINNHLCAD